MGKCMEEECRPSRKTRNTQISTNQDECNIYALP